jgi:hypothetical protein
MPSAYPNPARVRLRKGLLATTLQRENTSVDVNSRRNGEQSCAQGR